MAERFLPPRDNPLYMGKYWEYVKTRSDLYEKRQIPRRRATAVWRFYREVLEKVLTDSNLKKFFLNSKKQFQLLYYFQIPASRDFIRRILTELKKGTVPPSVLGPFIQWAFRLDGELIDPGPAVATFLRYLWVCLVKRRGKHLFVFHVFVINPDNERAKRTRWDEILHGTPEGKDVKAVFSKDEASHLRITHESEVRIDFWVFPPVFP